MISKLHKLALALDGPPTPSAASYSSDYYSRDYGLLSSDPTFDDFLDNLQPAESYGNSGSM